MDNATFIACNGTWQAVGNGISCTGDYVTLSLTQLQMQLMTASQLTMNERMVIISGLIGFFALIFVFKRLLKQVTFY